MKPIWKALKPLACLIGVSLLYLLAGLFRPLFLAILLFDPVGRQRWNEMSDEMADLLEGVGLVIPKAVGQ